MVPGNEVLIMFTVRWVRSMALAGALLSVAACHQADVAPTTNPSSSVVQSVTAQDSPSVSTADSSGKCPSNVDGVCAKGSVVNHPEGSGP